MGCLRRRLDKGSYGAGPGSAGLRYFAADYYRWVLGPDGTTPDLGPDATHHPDVATLETVVTPVLCQEQRKQLCGDMSWDRWDNNDKLNEAMDKLVDKPPAGWKASMVASLATTGDLVKSMETSISQMASERRDELQSGCNEILLWESTLKERVDALSANQVRLGAVWQAVYRSIEPLTAADQRFEEAAKKLARVIAVLAIRQVKEDSAIEFPTQNVDIILREFSSLETDSDQGKGTAERREATATASVTQNPGVYPEEVVPRASGSGLDAGASGSTSQFGLDFGSLMPRFADPAYASKAAEDLKAALKPAKLEQFAFAPTADSIPKVPVKLPGTRTGKNDALLEKHPDQSDPDIETVANTGAAAGGTSRGSSDGLDSSRLPLLNLWVDRACKCAIKAVIAPRDFCVHIRVNRFIGAAPATRSIFTFNLKPMLIEAKELAEGRPFKIEFQVRDPDSCDRFATQYSLKETTPATDHKLRCYVLAQPKKNDSAFNEWWDPYFKADEEDDRGSQPYGSETNEPV